MKRSSLIGLFASLLMLGALGCPDNSKPCDPNAPLKEKAQLCADRLSLGFGMEFGSGTYIGTSVPNTLSIRNGGLEDLIIDSVSLLGPKEFAMTVADPDGGTDVPITVPGNEHMFVQLTFAPKAAMFYDGGLVIKSNAENTPAADSTCGGGGSGEWCFKVTGCGVPADGGTSPCQRAIP
jgi:hypothetical protein